MNKNLSRRAKLALLSPPNFRFLPTPLIYINIHRTRGKAIYRDGPMGHKNIFNKSERRCRDAKTQKACKQGWEANIGPKIKQTFPYNPT